MRLPYNKTFRELQIIGLDVNGSHATRDDLVRVYFRLSEPPPLGWAYIFTTVWRSLEYPSKRQIGVDRDTIWIDCRLNEMAACHMRQLEYAVSQTSAIYRHKAQEQAQEAVRQAQLQAQLHSKLVDLSQLLYPEPETQTDDRSLVIKCLRFFYRSRRTKHPLPSRREVSPEPLNHLNDYHHSRFQGAAMAPDGRSLWLDYYDHDQGGTRFCYRYVLSSGAPPRLISGYTHETSRLEYEIPIERIPRHVFSEARDWLVAHIEANTDQPHPKNLPVLLEYLREREMVAQGR